LEKFSGYITVVNIQHPPAERRGMNQMDIVTRRVGLQITD